MERKEQLTQNQLQELLESEGARTIVEAAEERGFVEQTELEAFALEHDLADDEVEQLSRELEAIGLDVGEPKAEGAEKPAAANRPRSPRLPRSARPTACSSSSPTSAGTSC